MSIVKSKFEYGDYQTPEELAKACCLLLGKLGTSPKAILEPTCGVGSFLKAGADGFGIGTLCVLDQRPRRFTPEAAGLAPAASYFSRQT